MFQLGAHIELQRTVVENHRSLQIIRKTCSLLCNKLRLSQCVISAIRTYYNLSLTFAAKRNITFLLLGADVCSSSKKWNFYQSVNSETKNKHCIYNSSTNKDSEAKSSFRSWQFLSQSRNSQYFMRPEGSLSLSQQPATCPSPKADHSKQCPHPIPLLDIHFNIILPTSKWSPFPSDISN